jgi:Family of unknown function (DUF6527)
VQGRRLSDNFAQSPGFTWDSVNPGDYWKRTFDGSWFLCAPSGEAGGVDYRWIVTEHEDGTITVHPSIWFNKPTGWHGFLERGVWRQV